MIEKPQISFIRARRIRQQKRLLRPIFEALVQFPNDKRRVYRASGAKVSGSLLATA